MCWRLARASSDLQRLHQGAAVGGTGQRVLAWPGAGWPDRHALWPINTKPNELTKVAKNETMKVSVCTKLLCKMLAMLSEKNSAARGPQQHGQHNQAQSTNQQQRPPAALLRCTPTQALAQYPQHQRRLQTQREPTDDHTAGKLVL